MKKEEILRVLNQEEARMRVYDNTANKHTCTSRLAIRYVLAQEAKDLQMRNSLVSWKLIGSTVVRVLRDIVFVLGLTALLVILAWAGFILWDFYKQFI